MSSARSTPYQSLIPPILRDIRVLQIAGQIIFIILLATFISQITTGIFTSLQAKNLTPNLTFLGSRAGFDIGERPAWYSPDSTYWQAFQVGIGNTLRIVSVGLVLTTLLGVLVGIFLLSTNWLIRNISRVYVELLRNTPLLVQLYVWYFIVMLTLPPFQQGYALPAEGIAILPWRWLGYGILILLALRSVRHLTPEAPRRQATLVGVTTLIVVIEVGLWLASSQEGWRAVYGGGNLLSGTFLLYAAISAGLIASARLLVPEPWQGPALGAALGQAAGGVLLYLGIVPSDGLRLELYPAIYISIRGFVFPQVLPTARLAEWLAFVGVGAALAGMIWVYYGRVIETTGRPIPRAWYAAAALVGFTLAGWFLVAAEPVPAAVPVQQNGALVTLPLEQARAQGLLTQADEQVYSPYPLLFILPQRTNFRFTSGTEVSPEYMALLLGLVVYTSAFIAEIVRAGILAVPRGQIEAARALGFSTAQTLRLVILPQALRVIIPPLGNQYLNLSKNSSLGIAIAYADLFQVTTTIMNQSGQSVTGITMVMISYLAISLAISTVTNWVNHRFQLVTR